jgi:hypothetical protein
MEIARELAEQWDEDVEDVPRAGLRDGRLIEPLRHHAYPNRSRDRRIV